MRGSRRWIMGAIAAGVLCGSSRQGYAGEFGGFDIDIGTEEEIFDNWEEEPEESAGMPEGGVEEPEKNVEKQEERAEEPETRKGETRREEGKPEVRETEPKREEGKPVVREKEPEREARKPEVREKEPKRETEPKREKGNSEERKEEPEIKEKPERDEEPEVITVKPEMDENEQKRSRCTALGTVLTAVGMAKISPDLKYYNNNDENTEKTQNNNDYNNNTIYFEHENSIPEGEYPKIKIINTKEEQDVTILSVRMNQEEISWYLEGDTLVLEQPVTEKTSVIELIAVTDGKMLVSMPAWEFCYLDDIKK